MRTRDRHSGTVFAVWAAALMLLLSAPETGAAGERRTDRLTVTLREVVRVDPATPMVLGAIARIEGEGSATLAAIPIDGVGVKAADGSGTRTVTAQDVRELLEKQPGLNWGRVLIQGTACRVMRRAAPPAPGQAPPQPQPSAVEAEPAPAPPGTIREALEEKLRDLLRSSPSDLRVSFEEADRAFLDSSREGLSVEVQRVGASDRTPLSVTLYRGERIEGVRNVRAGVSIRTPVVSARGNLPRGHPINAEDLIADTRWLPPSVRPATLSQAVGAVTRSSVRAGEVLLDTHVEAPIVVRKGELVTVHCLSGMLKIETIGRASHAARDGEVVTFTDESGGRTFQARMSGRGRAVALVSGSETPQEENAETRSRRSFSKSN